ncbi:MAG TPA: hypothetical protein VKX28_18970 [Xanthobacteraceae bacterium]|nr:hypothetical protein [Xanthobacteraceae bacterium]
MKIGLIQTRGIGDIIIALPIAKYLVDQGHTVAWPIYAPYVPPFQAAAPYVQFIPLGGETGDWMFPIPLATLQERGCDRIISLASYIGGRRELVAQPELADIMKFDQYKYAVAGVPFREKWNLQIVRDRAREEALFARVVRDEEFVVCHLKGSNFRANVDVQAMAGGRQVIEISALTDNFFDWTLVIERASSRIMIDSCFSNLTDQLRFTGRNVFLIRSAAQFTPVLLGDWSYMPQS